MLAGYAGGIPHLEAIQLRMGRPVVMVIVIGFLLTEKQKTTRNPEKKQEEQQAKQKQKAEKNEEKEEKHKEKWKKHKGAFGPG